MKNKKRIYLIPIITAFLIVSILGGFFVYRFYQSEISELKNPESIKYFYQTKDNKKITISINDLETIDDIITKLNSKGTLKGETALKILAISKDYTDNNIYAGDYIFEGKYSLNELINKFKIKARSTIEIQIPENIRTINEMFFICEEFLHLDSNSLSKYIQNSEEFLNGKFNEQTLPALFIPNTYELYTDITVKEFFNKINNEYENFWKEDIICIRDNDTIKDNRENQLLYLNTMLSKENQLTRIDVTILASIVEEEQDRRLEERSMIAGLYLNRIRDNMKLESDPTVIFANNDFTIRRVLYKHLEYESEYNTYLNYGLPPGPICIASINSIDAVLNFKKHDYIFMCGKGDGTGLHNFARTLREHNNNRNKFKRNVNFN